MNEDILNMTTVFVLIASFVDDNNSDLGVQTEVNAVFASEDKAIDMGKWLMNHESVNAIRYVSYTVEEFYIL